MTILTAAGLNCDSIIVIFAKYDESPDYLNIEVVSQLHSGEFSHSAIPQ